MCSRVVLPAPFGPSSPVTPGPTEKETSLTATTLPYQRETRSTVTSSPSSTAEAGGALAVGGTDGATGGAVGSAVTCRCVR